MRKIRAFSKLFLVSTVSFLVTAFVAGGAAYAGQFYPGGYQRCLASSGGRQNFHSIQYACREAVESGHGNGQNACASWLGTSATDTSQKVYIYVTKGMTTAAINVYGMCTDRPNTSADMYTLFDGGSITVGNFTRGAPWGNVTSRAGTLDIAKFKNGATVFTRGTTKVYYRAVGLIRGHSDAQSYDYDIYEIYVIESEGEPYNPNLCQAWMPSSYPNSGENGGTTSIVVKARNTAGRFGGAMSGAWHHDNANPTGEIGPIYAMPTDVIQWHSCYYPGIQASAKTDVSDINGTTVNGGADDTWEYEWSKSTYVYLPDGRENCQSHHPSVGYKRLYRGWEENIGSEWQNRYRVGSDLGSGSGGDYGPGEYSWRDDFQRDGNRGMGTRRGGDVGRVLTQKAVTGIPITSSIGSETPSHDIHDWVTHYRQKYDDYTIELWKLLYNIDLSGEMEPYNEWEVVCTNSFSDDIRSASVSTGPASDSATVIVPYNFQNTTGVEISSDAVYSAEEISVTRAWVRVGTKYNNLTIADYATVVPRAEVAMFAYVSSSSDGGGGGMISGSASCNNINAKQCVEIKRVSFTDLNAGGSLSGSTDDVPGMAGTYNAFDASAGDYMCFVTAVNPYTSGADDAHGDSAGDGTYKFGYPACAVITKKPTFQVWGDSLYSYGGGVEGNVGKKRYLYNDYFTSKTNLCKGSTCYKPKGSYTATNFTSWVEESMNLYNGTVSNVASGAATGYARGNTKKAGTTNLNVCTLSPLTLSNEKCVSSVSAASVGNSKIPAGVTNRDELIRYWLGTNDGGVNWSTGTVNFANNPGTEIKTPTNMTLRYIHSNTSMSVYGSVAQSKTYLVIADGDVTITGDIRYNTGNYTLLGSIPKVIIYARNIYVACGVNEVDAILITRSGGTFDTCYNGGDENSSARARRLKVFGTVMADKVSLGRTYGAAAWNGSHNSGKTTDAEAAEVFDYDSTIPMWSEYMGGSAETDTLQIVYQHELAPRY